MPTLFTSMKRTFSTPKPQELLTRDQSSGGSYHLTSSKDLLDYHRRLKRGNLWPARIHRMLTAGLVLAFLAVLTGIWISALEAGAHGDMKKSEKWFSLALWSSGAFGVIIVAKVILNGAKK